MSRRPVDHEPVRVAVFNLFDRYRERAGDRVANSGRWVAVTDAVFDPRVRFLSLPPDVIERLGLAPQPADWYPGRLEPVRIEYMGTEMAGEPEAGPAGDIVRVGLTAITWLEAETAPGDPFRLQSPA